MHIATHFKEGRAHKKHRKSVLLCYSNNMNVTGKNLKSTIWKFFLLGSPQESIYYNTIGNADFKPV